VRRARWAICACTAASSREQAAELACANTPRAGSASRATLVRGEQFSLYLQ
jgi:hypothetical protein